MIGNLGRREAYWTLPPVFDSTLSFTSLQPNVGGQPRAARARPGFLPEDAARLGGWSALFGSPPFPRTALVVLSTPRSASLTASSEGKAAATSGSSKTKLLPLRSRATYLPRTPPFIDAKSYSGRRSLSLCRFALLIEPRSRLVARRTLMTRTVSFRSVWATTRTCPR